ncbi:MAG: LamG domain-containing protein [Candidatus Poribacteria bacterium]|nr:LamG domain-containing protein [Candidatus Poribacteria bacterium]
MKIATILSLGAMVLTVPLSRADVVGAWLFDETGGDVITDSSGNGHHGVLVGKVERTPHGKRGKALEFFEDEDGAPDWLWGHVLVPHHDDMNLLEFTVTAWIKVREFVEPGFGEGSISQTLVGKTSHISRSNYMMWIWGGGAGAEGQGGHVTIRFTVTKPLWASVSVNKTKAGANVIGGNWHHVAGTYKEPMLYLYVDGREVGRRENEPIKNPNTDVKELPQPSFAINRGKEGPFMIGAQLIGLQHQGQKPSHGIAGFMDEVGLFNTALPEEEIGNIARRGLGQYLSVDLRKKLATTWSKIKARE